MAIMIFRNGYLELLVSMRNQDNEILIYRNGFRISPDPYFFDHYLNKAIHLLAYFDNPGPEFG